MYTFNGYINVIGAEVSSSKPVFLTFLVLTNCHLVFPHTHRVVMGASGQTEAVLRWL